MGANTSSLESPFPTYHGSRSIDHPWPTRPHYPPRSRSQADAHSQSTRSASSTHTEPSHEGSSTTSSSNSHPQGRSSRASSSPSSHTQSSSGSLCRYYHRNPHGLAGFFDWEREEGGYIPYQYQAAHRQRWRREMRKARQEEQRARARKFEGVEEKKAAARRAWEEYQALKERRNEGGGCC